MGNGGKDQVGRSHYWSDGGTRGPWRSKIVQAVSLDHCRIRRVTLTSRHVGVHHYRIQRRDPTSLVYYERVCWT